MTRGRDAPLRTWSTGRPNRPDSTRQSPWQVFGRDGSGRVSPFGRFNLSLKRTAGCSGLVWAVRDAFLKDTGGRTGELTNRLRKPGARGAESARNVEVGGRGGRVRGRAMAGPEGRDSSRGAVAVLLRCCTGPCPLRIVVPGRTLVGLSVSLPRFGGVSDERRWVGWSPA